MIEYVRLLNPNNHLEAKGLAYTRFFSRYHNINIGDENFNFPESRQERYPGYLKIELVDTGCGIREEDLPKIFEKFTQVATAEKSTRKWLRAVDH